MALNNLSPFMPFQCIAVLGAAGKMGTGISLLLLQEMAACRLYQMAQKKVARPIRLVLIDTSRQGLDGLRKYLQTQLQRYAEKNIINLRKAAAEIPSLISNREIIEFFCLGAMEIVQLASAIEEAKDAQLIFEAIIENIDSKVSLLSALSKLSTATPYFFSNTSSIPISVLNDQAGLEGRIIGFHFYNPPAVQKLLEIIPLDNGNLELENVAKELAKSLNKQVVYSKDVAGFIGNGYFLREIAYACSMVRTMTENHGLLASIYMVNKVTQEFLLRPMGIFQLIDYVGLDVIERVGEIMNAYLPKSFYSNELLEPMLKAGKSGGQFSDGSQKDGFFQYTNLKMSGIYDSKANVYSELEKAEWKAACDAWLGNTPAGFTWKLLSNHPNSTNQIERFFIQLQEEKSKGAQIAFEFLQNLQSIVEQLVNDGVAASHEDVATVLKNGFYHLYDPLKINLCFKIA